jgi:hypothetical protein
MFAQGKPVKRKERRYSKDTQMIGVRRIVRNPEPIWMN